MNILTIIPARGGSKGVPGKNIKELCGKPLICYSIDVAREISGDEDICVTTDDRAIIRTVEDYGLHVPFVRPDELATDTATSNDVILHAYDFYKKGKAYDAILLLQPTSPLRRVSQIKEALELYIRHKDSADMIASVKKSHAAAVLARETDEGYLAPAFDKYVDRRQDADVYYEYNGAIYVINPKAIQEKGMKNFDRCIKYEMPEEDSFDIDTPLDWFIVESIVKGRIMNDRF